jgi:hypothetical protein
MVILVNEEIKPHTYKRYGTDSTDVKCENLSYGTGNWNLLRIVGIGEKGNSNFVGTADYLKTIEYRYVRSNPWQNFKKFYDTVDVVYTHTLTLIKGRSRDIGLKLLV